MGTDGPPGVPCDSPVTKWTHSDQSCGAKTKLTAAIVPATPTAIASWRHSRRTTNHRRPTPEVALVSRMTAHEAGCAKPMTIAAAMNRWMLPWYSSSATGGNARRARLQRPPSQMTVATMTAIHSHRKTHHGKAASWPMTLER